MAIISRRAGAVTAMAALIATAATLATSMTASATGTPQSNSTPECQQPSGVKCLAIDNEVYENKHWAFPLPAVNSITIRKKELNGNTHSNPAVSDCVNVSPGKRVYLSHHIRNVAPNDTIYVQGWSAQDCDGGNAVADWVSDDMTVPNDGLRYFWIKLHR
jgi:hypothetical protein